MSGLTPASPVTWCCRRLRSKHFASVNDATLADGTQTELSTHSCWIDWFGNTKTLEIIANKGECPLLGVGLLLGLELRVDYRNLRLELLPAPKDNEFIE